MKTDNITTLKPLRHRCIIKQDDAEIESEGGIIIPEDAQRKDTRGHVVALGSGRLTKMGVRIEPDFKEGDYVLFGRFLGEAIEGDNGEELVIINIEDVEAVL